MPNRFFHHCFAVIALVSTTPLGALSGSGDSAPGNLDTVPPTPGTADIPPTGPLSGFTISYSGAGDASGLGAVELWVREDSSTWAGYLAAVANFNVDPLPFFPPATGLYHFDLVAVDIFGNRSATPSGSIGTGQGSTLVSAEVTDWSVIDR